MGAIIRLIAVLILLGGVALFLGGQQGVNEYQTTEGRVVRFLSEEHRLQYELYSMMRIGGAIATAFGLLMFLGGRSSSSRKGTARNGSGASHKRTARNSSSSSRQRSEVSTSHLSPIRTQPAYSVKKEGRSGESVNYCPKCGTSVGRDDEYCYNCGEKIDDSPDT